MKGILDRANNFDTTQFEELNFFPHPNPNHSGGIQAIVKFSNGYGASIVKTPRTCGSRQGLYELAVIDKNGKLTYETSITDGVLHLSQDNITETLKKIKQLL